VVVGRRVGVVDRRIAGALPREALADPRAGHRDGEGREGRERGAHRDGVFVVGEQDGHRDGSWPLGGGVVVGGQSAAHTPILTGTGRTVKVQRPYSQRVYKQNEIPWTTRRRGAPGAPGPQPVRVSRFRGLKVADVCHFWKRNP